MVWLTRFDGTQFLLNTNLIQMVEATPDTVITLTNGHHLVVREAASSILEGLVAYQRRLAAPTPNVDEANV